MTMTTAVTLIEWMARLGASLLIGLAAVWGGMALWYRAPGGTIGRTFALALWCAFVVGVLAAAWRGHTAAVAAFAAGFAGLLVWWANIAPSRHHDWSDDVSRITTGTVDGERVTLHDVRNFDWRTQTDYTPRWETRSYDLDLLCSVDMVMSYWRGPSIAHMLISFGFTDGAQVVFSVEIRRRKTQAFSEVGGFFKEFELAIIAADERDVIRLRTNVRGERVFMYRLGLPRNAMRLFFLSYVDAANRLEHTPRFYHTITGNCTTLVYRMMRRIVPRLPLHYRLLFSGYMPEYVYAVGGLDKRRSLDQLRESGYITERARAVGNGTDFSAAIRRGIADA